MFTRISVDDLRAAVSVHPGEFDILFRRFMEERVIHKLRRRVGLVPNYFIARGEAVSSREMRTSLKACCRKLLEKALKVARSKDFRDEESFEVFEEALKFVSQLIQDNPGYIPDIAGTVNELEILHFLVTRRQLKFIKCLLLNIGHIIDINSRNSQGYAALDLAKDRLETEIVFLLLLHGAGLSTGGIQSLSLNYPEWVFYDIGVNLDTGRWLHKKSETAVMEHAETSISAPLSVKILHWATDIDESMDEETIKMLTKIPQLFSIVLADGCDAITNHEAWATLIRYMKTMHENYIGKTIEPSFIISEYDRPTRIDPDDLNVLVRRNGADNRDWRVAGRTVFYSCGNGAELAVKFSKDFEETKSPHPLAKEAYMNHTVSELKQKYGLLSDYPVTVKLVRLKDVPEAIRNSIEEQCSLGFHSFRLGEGSVTALLYRPPKGYGNYVNDPSLPLDVAIGGIRKATFDTAVLARHGFYHGALVDIQHDATREQRPHLWSFESFLTRFRSGAGRIERGFAGLSAPNVRESGLGDLKHILTNTNDVMARYDPSVIHAQHNILYDDKERLEICLIEQLGSGLFASALLTASCWHGRYLNAVPEHENLDLAHELKMDFINFLCGYLKVKENVADRLLKLWDTDFNAMADQIKLFTTSEYARIAETAPKRPVFGALAKVLGLVSHPTAFVHFCQRGSSPLDAPGYSLGRIKKVYVKNSTPDYFPEGFPRVDTSMMRCSPTWKKGRGWVSNHKTGSQSHFGAYEGVLPFQQLIRDLYVVVYMSRLIRTRGLMKL